MKFKLTSQFERNYKKLPPNIQKQFHKKLILFQEKFDHPSLRVEKLKSTSYWAESIDMNYRFVFKIERDSYIFMNGGSHNILDKF